MDTVIKANIEAMENAVKSMKQTAANVTNYEKELKTTLNKRIKAYDTSVNRFIKHNSLRDFLLFVVVLGGILAVIVLIVNQFL